MIYIILKSEEILKMVPTQKKYRYLCPHGKTRKDYCIKCRGNLFCEHEKYKYTCRTCHPHLKCPCGYNKYKCKKCKINLYCNHRIKKGRCDKCRKPDDFLHNLDDYQKGDNKDEVCYCNLCILSDRVTKGLTCFVCKERDVYKMARCSQCFTVYSKCSITSQKFEKMLNNSEYLKPKKTALDILDKEYHFIYPDHNYILNAASKLDKITNDIDTGKVDSSTYMQLQALFKIFTKISKRSFFVMQLYFSVYCLEKIEKIFDYFIDSKYSFEIVRIIWFLILRNPYVMNELISKSNLFSKMTKNLKENNSTSNLLNNMTEIIKHLNAFGFN